MRGIFLWSSAQGERPRRVRQNAVRFGRRRRSRGLDSGQLAGYQPIPLPQFFAGEISHHFSCINQSSAFCMRGIFLWSSAQGERPRRVRQNAVRFGRRRRFRGLDSGQLARYQPIPLSPPYTLIKPLFGMLRRCSTRCSTR